jgi:acid phosphatase family membrane protein YuiD
LVALEVGVNSIAFSIALVFSLFIIWDALGLRQTVGNHAHILNMLIVDLPDYQESHYPHLNKKIGHTGPQVFVGALVGIALTYLLYQLVE